MAKIFNNLLCTTALFLLCFAWTKWSLNQNAIAFALSAIVALSASYVIHVAQNQRENKLKIKKLRKQEVQNLVAHMQYCPDNGQILSPTFAYFGFDVIDQRFDSLIAQKEGQKCYVAIDMDLTSKALPRYVIDAKRNGCKKLYVACNRAEKEWQQMTEKHIPTNFMDANNLYALMNQSATLPPLSPCKQSKNNAFFKYAFCKNRCKWYALSCLFLVALYPLSYLKWYTLGWASVMMAMAIYCLVNKKYNGVATAVTLD